MEISEYKRRKQADTVRFRRINKDRIVVETEIYDQATGELIDIQQRTVDPVQIQQQITQLQSQLADLQELLSDLNQEANQETK